MSNIALINKPKERQTPIEIALQIDGQGMTTAKALYSFLELHPAHYAKWAKKNIVNNTFASENIDYIPFTLQGERGGQVSTDYKLTADFAKKLCMVSKSPKGEEARDYFIMVEQNAKKLANSVPAATDQLEVAAIMIQELKDQRTRLNQVEGTVTDIKGTMEAVKETLCPEETTWNEMIHKYMDKIVEYTGDYYGAWSESYRELGRIGFDIRRRHENAQERMAKRGCTKAEIKALTKLQVIEQDRKAKQAYANIVREMVLKYVI